MAQEQSANDEKTLDPEGARIVAKVRRLMMIASLTTFMGAVVIGVIGYRVFRGEGRVQQISAVFTHIARSGPGRCQRYGRGRAFALTVDINKIQMRLLSFDLNTAAERIRDVRARRRPSRATAKLADFPDRGYCEGIAPFV